MSDVQSSGAELVEQSVQATQQVEAEVTRPVDPTETAEIQEAERVAGGVEMIPMALIEKSEVSLRGVNRQTEQYMGLVDSIKKKGVLNSILVREIKVGEVTKYGLIDGLQRFTASTDAGLTEIPARIVQMNDAELLEAQIITNMNRVQTKPAELSKHLLRILARNPFMTKAELASKVCQSLSWIEQRLSINKLRDEIQELVNEGRIHLTNAYALSKIPEEEQGQHVDSAMTESPKTFVPRMKARVKEIRDTKNAGKDPSAAEFKPVQHLQKVAEIKSEYNALHTGEGESKILVLLKKHNVTDPLEAAKLAVAWALNFDEESQAEQKRQHEIKEKKREEKQAKLKAEREAKKQEEAAQAAADITTM